MNEGWIDYIDKKNGDLVLVKDNGAENLEVFGIAGSVECFDDMDIPVGNYKVLRAIDVYTRSEAERSTDYHKLIEFSTFEIEIFRKASDYVTGQFIYHFKIWNSEKDSYEELKSNHIESNTFTDYKEALEKAKEEIIFAEEEDYYG